MKKSYVLLLLLSTITLSLFGGTPQNTNNGQNYIELSKKALDNKNYDECMRWARRYINEYHSYSQLANISEQMNQEAARIYPNDKKAFIKPLEYAGELGNAQSLYLLGMHYFAGQYLPKDIDKSMALLKAAEKLGHPKAAAAYATIARSSDYIEHKAKQQRYTEKVLGTVGFAALIAIAAEIIGNRSSSSYSSSSYGSSSYSSSSSSSSSYSSSTLSSSNSSQTTSSSKSESANTHTCNLTIKYETISGNWVKLIQNNIEVTFHRGRFSQSGGYKKYWVDTNGNCTITWTDDRGDSIERISFSEDGHGYCIKDISLKDGGTYSLNAPWKW